MAVLVTCSGCLPPCVPLHLDEDLQTGIRGTVTLSPTCPIQTEEDPCVEPFQANLRVECPEGFEIMTIRSDTNGEFEVRLPPGEYRVVPLQPDPQSPYPFASPMNVVVPADGFAEVQVNYDTGIR